MHFYDSINEGLKTLVYILFLNWVILNWLFSGIQHPLWPSLGNNVVKLVWFLFLTWFFSLLLINLVRGAPYKLRCCCHTISLSMLRCCYNRVKHTVIAEECTKNTTNFVDLICWCFKLRLLQNSIRFRCLYC